MERLAIAASVALAIGAVAVLAVGVSPPEVEAPIPIALEPPPSAVRPMPEAPQVVPDSAFVAGPGETTIADVIQGTGTALVGPDRTVVFDYVAWSADHRAVGSSYTRPAPNRVPLTADGSGWTIALSGMTAGGVRQVRLPADGATRTRTLIEVVVHEVLVPPVPVVVEPQRRTRLPSGIEIADVAIGEGAAAEMGYHATFEYAVFDGDGGTELDSSWRRASPVRMQLGRDRLQFLPVLLGMTVGTRRQAWVSPAIAFPQGPPEGIDPERPLVLVVELTAITTSVNMGDASHTDGPERHGH